MSLTHAYPALASLHVVTSWISGFDAARALKLLQPATCLTADLASARSGASRKTRPKTGLQTDMLSDLI